MRAEIWSYGIRNPQGMAMNPWSNALWLNEHGPRGGDEINIPQKAKTTAGRWQPGESTIRALRYRKRKGRSSPGPSNLFLLEDSPAVSGMAFYNSDKFPSGSKSYLLAR